MRYRDRSEAGRILAGAVVEAGVIDDGVVPLVLGIARGGVPVAAEVASALNGDLDVAVARKIGAPGNPEFAIGAVAGEGRPLLNERVITDHRVPSDYVSRTLEEARAEIARREAVYRSGWGPLPVRGRTVIVVDDGVATGSTLIAVLRSVKALGAASVVCAVPVGPPDTIGGLAEEADAVVCPLRPRWFSAVGGWYDDFGQLSDDDVVSGLAAH
jgi:putative phosphoribosyl transferase